MDEDSQHTNEFGEIEAFKDTEYWFKKDFQTIKRSPTATLKAIPLILLATYLFSLLMTQLGGTGADFPLAFIYSLVFSPIFLLGYLMFHIIATKGYDIDPYAGTHINSPQHVNRFSVSYIMNSDMPTGRKIMFLLRYAFYVLLAIGLLLNVFVGLKK